ncbi:MAG: hypothetical protein CVV41_13170 [Candidatus Riflebacteria bacterium HGW-Riflebacteria-1]|nr:MAG: hypothetical protein CVV41_13170 [Candidatus Riflebacteria bacterium HGW-Riflebacteria-1]
MLKALTTEHKASKKTVGILVIISLFFLSGTAAAEVFRPLQILMPGNLGGNLATLDRNLKIETDLCWRVVELLDSFRKLKDKDSVVLAPGNDSSVYSAVNYLFRGALERELIGQCRPDAQGLSPNDLEMFADSGLTREIRSRIWTNQETSERQTIFAPYKKLNVGNQNIWYFNFISPEFCSYLPLSNWGNLELDSPQRSLRRLNIELSKNDITISTAYLNASAISQLAIELQQRPGWHIIVQIPPKGSQPLFSTTVPQQRENLWFISYEDGHRYLPMINIFRRNSGAPRINLRRLPFSKSGSRLAAGLFEAARDQIKQMITRPLRVIKPSSQATTSAYRFAGKQFARLIRQASNSDVTFLRVPEMQHLVDNVICTGHILATMENDRIHSFRLSGRELFELAAAMVKDSDTKPTAFAGCEITWFAGRVSELKVAGQAYRPDKSYLVSTTEETLNDIALKRLDAYRQMSGYEGNTLWKVWKDNLKSLRADDKQLVE